MGGAPQYGLDNYIGAFNFKVAIEDIELKRIYQQVDAFYEWRVQIENGNIQRKNVTISLMLPDMSTVVRTMTIMDCYPSKWELPPMDASSSEAAVETITLTCSHVIQG